MTTRWRNLWPFQRKAVVPAVAGVPAPEPARQEEPPPGPQLLEATPPAALPQAPLMVIARRYRQFKFLVDGRECVVQSDYASQADNQALTEAWAREQVAQAFPQSRERRLVGVQDFVDQVASSAPSVLE